MAIGLNMAHSTYSKIERESKIPEPDLLEKIAKQFEVEPSMLLSSRELADLLLKNEFKQKAKALMRTWMGAFFYWILVVQHLPILKIEIQTLLEE